MKRPASSPAPKKGQWSCPDEMVVSNFPHIAQMMCDGWWDDQKPRELSTISVNFSQGLPTVCLNDHALQRTAYTTADSVLEALRLLEEALADDSLKWRPWKVGKGK